MEEGAYGRKAGAQDQPDQEDNSADEEEDEDSDEEERRPARKRGKSAGNDDYKSKPRRKASQKPVGSDARRQAFSKRKRGIILKAYQLYSLTDAKVFLFLVNGKGSSWVYASPGFGAALQPEHIRYLREVAEIPSDAKHVTEVVAHPKVDESDRAIDDRHLYLSDITDSSIAPCIFLAPGAITEPPAGQALQRQAATAMARAAAAAAAAAEGVASPSQPETVQGGSAVGGLASGSGNGGGTGMAGQKRTASGLHKMPSAPISQQGPTGAGRAALDAPQPVPPAGNDVFPLQMSHPPPHQQQPQVPLVTTQAGAQANQEGEPIILQGFGSNILVHPQPASQHGTPPQQLQSPVAMLLQQHQQQPPQLQIQIQQRPVQLQQQAPLIVKPKLHPKPQLKVIVGDPGQPGPGSQVSAEEEGATVITPSGARLAMAGGPQAEPAVTGSSNNGKSSNASGMGSQAHNKAPQQAPLAALPPPPQQRSAALQPVQAAQVAQPSESRDLSSHAAAALGPLPPGFAWQEASDAAGNAFYLVVNIATGAVYFRTPEGELQELQRVSTPPAQPAASQQPQQVQLQQHQPPQQQQQQRPPSQQPRPQASQQSLSQQGQQQAPAQQAQAPGVQPQPQLLAAGTVPAQILHGQPGVHLVASQIESHQQQQQQQQQQYLTQQQIRPVLQRLGLAPDSPPGPTLQHAQLQVQHAQPLAYPGLQGAGTMHLTLDPSAFAAGLAPGAHVALQPNIMDVSQLLGIGGMQMLQNATLLPGQGPGGQTVWVLANPQGQYPQLGSM